jgi:hypothetical protein
MHVAVAQLFSDAGCVSVTVSCRHELRNGGELWKETSATLLAPRLLLQEEEFVE